MSKLKAETIVPQGSAITLQMYPKAETDAALAAKDKEIRRLKRALYKACEEWFKNKACALKCFNLDARAKKFDKTVDKCRAMAEKFK